MIVVYLPMPGYRIMMQYFSCSLIFIYGYSLTLFVSCIQ